MRHLLALVLLQLACAPSVSFSFTPPPSATDVPTFDSRAAWDEFEDTLRSLYAYLDRDDISVEQQLAHARSHALAATSPRAFRAVLYRASLAFTDPHFSVGPREDTDPNVFPTTTDLVVERRDGVDFIADVRLDSAADEAGIRPGFKLLTIDGTAVDDAAEDLWDGVVLDKTDRQRSFAATLLANGRRDGRPRTLKVDDGERVRTIELPNPAEFADTVRERPTVTYRSEEAWAYIRIENSLGKMETVDAFDRAIEALLDAPVLVVDLRNTPSGGNTEVARAIIGHFVTEASPYQVHEIPAIERRYGVPRRFVELVLPRAPHFSGRVVVLGGRWTGSMGEGLVIGMHGAAGARTFASDMGHLLGAVHNLELEVSGLQLDLGLEALFHVDGTPRERYVAEHPLPSADLDREGNDAALEAVRAWLASEPCVVRQTCVR